VQVELPSVEELIGDGTELTAVPPFLQVSANRLLS